MIKRSVTLKGHRTSVSLEEPFWEALRELAEKRRVTLAQLISGIDEKRGNHNLSSAIRVTILELYRTGTLK